MTTVATLDAALWRERELLEALRRALEIERFVLAGGRARWLTAATAEVRRLAEAVRETELLRAMEADAVAQEVGLTPAPPLSALASALGAGWGTVLLEHRDALCTLTTCQRSIAATAGAIPPSLTALLR